MLLFTLVVAESRAMILSGTKPGSWEYPFRDKCRHSWYIRAEFLLIVPPVPYTYTLK